MDSETIDVQQYDELQGIKVGNNDGYYYDNSTFIPYNGMEFSNIDEAYDVYNVCKDQRVWDSKRIFFLLLKIKGSIKKNLCGSKAPC